MKNSDKYNYNERLFSGGLRGHLHLSRFKWLQHQIKRLHCTYESVIEIGCFDGKLLGFLPQRPKRYCGYDANWENGLDIARRNWGKFPQYTFYKVNVPDDMMLEHTDSFDIAVIMETLEHLSPELVEGYLKKIGEHTRQYVFITVPNEKGIVFLAKWLIKRTFSKDMRQYSLLELINATLGRMDKVKRHEHKGFDYLALIHEVEKYYDIVSVSGLPLRFLPPFLSFGVGIIGHAKDRT